MASGDVLIDFQGDPKQVISRQENPTFATQDISIDGTESVTVGGSTQSVSRNLQLTARIHPSSDKNSPFKRGVQYRVLITEV
jgi:hypothetical protein